MKESEQKTAAKAFADKWKDKGYEKGESQVFWLSLLRDIFGVTKPEEYITFEDKVHLDHTSFIDGYITNTKVMIEQKGLGKDLRKPIKQSDGSMLTPFQQAKRYITELPLSLHPRYVITCNFSEFNVYDMEKPGGEPEVIYLKDLEKEYYRLGFLVDTKDSHLEKEVKISKEAGIIVGEVYDEFLKAYADPENIESLKSLNVLCVRLVFLLYAEDSGILGKHAMFHDYMAQYPAKEWRNKLIELFRILDTKPEDRDTYLDDDLAAFPYVNGGLFADENIEIPKINEQIVELVLNRASNNFDWSEISPTIFGAVFESTLNAKIRRSGGMHYTSIRDIHRVIDPLFLDELKKELDQICDISVLRERDKKLKLFQKKLTTLTFFDPACGSGNFLTETYLSIRRLENRVIELLTHGQMSMGFEGANPIQVSIGQFYGIEINDFAVTVAKTALWISEHQCLKETESIVHMYIDFLPLKTDAHIVEGNALRMDWESVVPKNKLKYIMGNPPFVGYSLQNKEQKADMLSVYVDEKGKPYKTAGKLDYVSGWYFKASEFIQGTDVKVAFVSTNSITQGEQVAGVWKPLYKRFGIHIEFAYRSFVWDSESNEKAHVHVVIIGFSNKDNGSHKYLYENDRLKEVKIISPYLLEAPLVLIDSTKKPICEIPEMVKGSSPVDGGNLLLSQEEYDELLSKNPASKSVIRPFLGAKEYINNTKRYCIWIETPNPSELAKMPLIKERISATREFRLSSTKAATVKYADYPTRFMECRQPNSTYILVPRHSSERRRYIPFGFVNPDIICGDANNMIPDASLYHFGIMTSNVHMAWVRVVCGRIKSDYRYSNDIVYNNFPWPTPTDEQKEKIEKTAQAILDARALYPNASLADLYDDVLMPPELRTAHQNNDRAVMDAYDFYKIENGKRKFLNENECVGKLMEMYQEFLEVN